MGWRQIWTERERTINYAVSVWCITKRSYVAIYFAIYFKVITFMTFISIKISDLLLLWLKYFVTYFEKVLLLSLMLQCLRSLVRHSLELAAKDHVSSISFPAVGSGNLRFPHSTVSRIMFDEAISFSARAGHLSSLNNIYFVVYDKDQTTVNVRNAFMYL